MTLDETGLRGVYFITIQFESKSDTYLKNKKKNILVLRE